MKRAVLALALVVGCADDDAPTPPTCASLGSACESALCTKDGRCSCIVDGIPTACVVKR